MSHIPFTAALAAAFLTAAPGSTAVNLVTNGDFSSTTANASRQMSDDASKGGTQYVAGWTNAAINSSGAAGYSFIVNSVAAATTPGGIQANDYAPLSLWGGNGFTDSTQVGGSGGNFLAADGAFEQGLIYQVITGLTVGQQYDLSFNWAGAQQYGYSGATYENWTAYFGTSTSNFASFTTGNVTDANHGFTGWQTANTSFTATGSTEVLGFLAGGTPGGQPPFALLDDVSLVAHGSSAVPEPASWAMMIAGFAMVGGALRRRRVPGIA